MSNADLFSSVIPGDVSTWLILYNAEESNTKLKSLDGRRDERRVVVPPSSLEDRY